MTATAGLLLTGGSSSRLGVSKAELRRQGERLADRGARLLTASCATALEVGPGVSTLDAVREDPPGAGPLAAVVTGARTLASRGLLTQTIVLAVDHPFVEATLLEWLAAHPARRAVVPRVAGVAQPLCARYGAADLDVAAGLAARGARSMRALLDAVPVAYADEDAWGTVADARAFEDVDTPDDAARAGLEWPAEPHG